MIHWNKSNKKVGSKLRTPPRSGKCNSKTELSRRVTDHLTVSMVIEREKKENGEEKITKKLKKLFKNSRLYISTLKAVKSSCQDQRIKTNTKHHLSS